MRKQRRRLVKASWYAASALIILATLWGLSFAFRYELPSSSTSCTFYSTDAGQSLRKVYVQAIREAEHSILLIIYSLSDRKIIHALRQKAAQGVDVQVLCDSKASAGVWRKLGAKVRVFPLTRAGLMHQKILVVDSCDVFVGSANMTPSSLQQHSNLVAGCHSTELASFVEKKALAMTVKGRVVPLASQEFLIGGQKVEMCFLPDDQHCVRNIRQLIRSAKKSVKVAMFTWTRKDFAHDLIHAANSGVNVSVVLDRNSALSCSGGICKLLEEKGVAVRLSKGDALNHHKFMVIDDQVLVHGSANWTIAAFTRNDDCLMIVHDLSRDQSAFLSTVWDAIFSRSEPAFPLHSP